LLSLVGSARAKRTVQLPKTGGRKGGKTCGKKKDEPKPTSESPVNATEKRSKLLCHARGRKKTTGTIHLQKKTEDEISEAQKERLSPESFKGWGTHSP